MRLALAPATAAHCVRAVEVRDGQLCWVDEGVTNVLVVWGPYGVDITVDDTLFEAVEALPGEALRRTSGTVRLADGRSLMLRRVSEIAASSFSCESAHMRYAVFGCTYEQGVELVLTMYVPNDLGSVEADAPAKARVSVRRRTASERVGFGPFARDVERLCGYTLRIDCASAFEGGEPTGLAYGYEGMGWSYPVVGGMLNRDFEVDACADRPPRVFSFDDGFEVETS